MWHSRKEKKSGDSEKKKQPEEEVKTTHNGLPEGHTDLQSTALPEKTPLSNGFVEAHTPAPAAPIVNGNKPRRPPLPSQESIDRMQRIKSSGSSFDEEPKLPSEPVYSRRSSGGNPFRNDAPAPKTTPSALEGTKGHEIFMSGPKETKSYSRRMDDERDPFADDEEPARTQPVHNPYARPRPRPKGKMESQQNIDLMGDFSYGNRANPFK
jgi:hypothetical protein